MALHPWNRVPGGVGQKKAKHEAAAREEKRLAERILEAATRNSLRYGATTHSGWSLPASLGEFQSLFGGNKWLIGLISKTKTPRRPSFIPHFVLRAILDLARGA